MLNTFTESSAHSLFSDSSTNSYKEVIQLAVDTVYSSKHVSCLAWLSKKRPFRSNKWKDLEHVDSMKSLVLKNDVQEMFKEYVAEHNTRWPDVRHMKESLFYEITRLEYIWWRKETMCSILCRLHKSELSHRQF